MHALGNTVGFPGQLGSAWAHVMNLNPFRFKNWHDCVFSPHQAQLHGGRCEADGWNDLRFGFAKAMKRASRDTGVQGRGYADLPWTRN